MSSGTDVRVGIVTSGDREEIRRLESMPIDSLWVGGHVASRNPSPEAMVGLARLAALTERVTVGSSILLLPLYPPALVAKQIADLDRATGGRIVLGVGVGGEYPEEFRALGVPIRERGRRADEIIPLLRRLWTAGAISHDGPHYAMQDVRIHPPPAQRGGPPIVVAGRKEAAMRRAATLGDGWFPYLYSPRRYGTSAEAIGRIAAGSGRDLTGFLWCVWVFVNVDDDGDVARDVAARALRGSYDRDIRAMIEKVAAAGTPTEVVATLRAFYDAGARHFVFSPATAESGRRRVLDRLVGEILPGLYQHASRRVAPGVDPR